MNFRSNIVVSIDRPEGLLGESILRNCSRTGDSTDDRVDSQSERRLILLVEAEL